MPGPRGRCRRWRPHPELAGAARGSPGRERCPGPVKALQQLNDCPPSGDQAFVQELLTELRPEPAGKVDQRPGGRRDKNSSRLHYIGGRQIYNPVYNDITRPDAAAPADSYLYGAGTAVFEPVHCRRTGVRDDSVGPGRQRRTHDLFPGRGRYAERGINATPHPPQLARSFRSQQLGVAHADVLRLHHRKQPALVGGEVAERGSCCLVHAPSQHRPSDGQGG